MIALKAQVKHHVYFSMKTCLRSLLMLWNARGRAIHMQMMLLGLAGLFLFMEPVSSESFYLTGQVTVVSCKRKYISRSTTGSCLESNYKIAQIVLCTCAFLGLKMSHSYSEPLIPVCCFPRSSVIYGDTVQYKLVSE
ncbi:hypothetical protein G4B88_026735 [Cannabis sativa]|uniref:Uncharacterized protein n=1 Tax=Cannabis sativa TaxID=3483 RepID=A0A7J6F9G4_CANSA|nr:hypothetical protein G4B88_026735 [Cannabis sativa]